MGSVIDATCYKYTLNEAKIASVASGENSIYVLGKNGCIYRTTGPSAHKKVFSAKKNSNLTFVKWFNANDDLYVIFKNSKNNNIQEVWRIQETYEEKKMKSFYNKESIDDV
jgi:hypothetical protein